jgi:hypothetical protein
VSDPVGLRVRFASADDEAGLDHEEIAATLVDAAAGTYRLESSSFFVPLAAGDLVRAAADSTGELQVVDVVEPCDAVLTIFAPDPEASPEAITALMRIWTAVGAGQSERGGPFVATVWPDMPMDAVAAQTEIDLGGH